MDERKFRTWAKREGLRFHLSFNSDGQVEKASAFDVNWTQIDAAQKRWPGRWREGGDGQFRYAHTEIDSIAVVLHIDPNCMVSA